MLIRSPGISATRGGADPAFTECKIDQSIGERVAALPFALGLVELRQAVFVAVPAFAVIGPKLAHRRSSGMPPCAVAWVTADLITALIVVFRSRLERLADERHRS